MEAKTDDLGGREAMFFIGAISWGVVPCELTANRRQKIFRIIPGWEPPNRPLPHAVPSAGSPQGPWPRLCP